MVIAVLVTDIFHVELLSLALIVEPIACTRSRTGSAAFDTVPRLVSPVTMYRDRFPDQHAAA